jgi:hypothetical protein
MKWQKKPEVVVSVWRRAGEFRTREHVVDIVSGDPWRVVYAVSKLYTDDIYEWHIRVA